MSKIIGFNADEQMKLMAQALATRLGFSDVSAMLRSILDDKINETFTEQERAQIMALLSPVQSAKQSVETKEEYKIKKQSHPKVAGKR